MRQYTHDKIEPDSEVPVDPIKIPNGFIDIMIEKNNLAVSLRIDTNQRVLTTDLTSTQRKSFSILH